VLNICLFDAIFKNYDYHEIRKGGKKSTEQSMTMKGTKIGKKKPKSKNKYKYNID